VNGGALSIGAKRLGGLGTRINNGRAAKASEEVSEEVSQQKPLAHMWDKERSETDTAFHQMGSHVDGNLNHAASRG
jgi:hypothetical protein